MKALLACGLGILLVVGVATGGDDKADKAELDKLQGSWVIDKDGKKAELKFEKDKFTLYLEGESAFKGTIKIDSKKKPKEMDMTVSEGIAFQGETSKAIYEIDGDTLKWCAPIPGKDRPKNFDDTTEGLNMTFKKAK